MEEEGEGEGEEGGEEEDLVSARIWGAREREEKKEKRESSLLERDMGNWGRDTG